MKVLTVTADVPWPCIGGARTRNAHLASALSRTHEVEVLALSWGDRPVVAPSGIQLQAVPWELPALHAAAEAGDLQAWENLFSADAEPYGISYYDSPGMETAIASACATRRPDVAVLTETAMARFRHVLPEGLPFVLDLHDVHAVKQARRGDPDQAGRLKDFEASAAADAAVTVCVSTLEATAAADLLGARRVEVVPNGVDMSHFRTAEDDGDDDRLVFTGSLHTKENVEAVLWFVEHVLPLVRDQRPRVSLDVVGSRPPDELRRLAGGPIRIHGDVPDTVPFLHRAGTVVVPLLHGGGTRLKVLEAASAGRAVVTTSVGVEGLDLHDGEHVAVADDAASFADAVVRMCGSRETRRRLADAARFASAKYEWEQVGRHWTRVVESVVQA